MGKKAKDKRDIYYRKAKEEGYRARSSYKLLQIDEEFNIFGKERGITRVIDLCAAPGSWSQVISQKLTESLGLEELLRVPHIVSVDLFEMAPILGCTIIKGDITREKTIQDIQAVFGGEQAELVVSDGAPDVLGDHDFDQFVQHQLVLAALNTAIRVLKKDRGNFIAKVFRGKDIGLLIKQTKCFFNEVYMAKPKTCRNSSIEAFMVAIGFKGKEHIGLSSDKINLWDSLTVLNHLQNYSQTYYGIKEEDLDNSDDEVEFVACGKNEILDADMNYSLDQKTNGEVEKVDELCVGQKRLYKYIEPIQGPINAPYKQFIENRNEIINKQ